MNLCLTGARDVKLEYKILKEKVREYNKRDAQFYGNMFAKMNKLEHATTAVRPLSLLNLAFRRVLLLLVVLVLLLLGLMQGMVAKHGAAPMTIDSKA